VGQHRLAPTVVMVAIIIVLMLIAAIPIVVTTDCIFLEPVHAIAS
jgi:hypothetical protein